MSVIYLDYFMVVNLLWHRGDTFMANMKFGECLKLLLSILGVSMNQLSKAINVDNSLVNRWIHEKRVPLYNTPYIERISEYLSKNVTNTFQIQHLNKLFMDICEKDSSEDHTKPEYNIKEKIKKMLSETQGYSIECKKQEKIAGSPDKDNFTSEFSDGFVYNPSDYISLSSKDKIIMGSSNVLSAAFHLLKAAASRHCGNNNTIYISLINDTDIISLQYTDTDLVNLREVFKEIMKKGWNIILFIRLNSNINKIKKLINFVKPLIKIGKLNPYYLKRYDVFAIGREALCIPEVGALSCFSTNSLFRVDCAFYFKNKVAVDILKSYFNVLLATCAQPLFNYYPEKDCSKYNRLLIKNEESIGDRILYKDCFGILTIPKSLHKKILKKIGLSRDDMLASQEYYEKRLKAFLVNVENYEYKDIYCYESVIQFIKHRKFFFYFPKGVKPVDLEVKDIIEILRNIISLLKRYKNYNIAFNHECTDCASGNGEFYCMVKERQAVLIEAYDSSKGIPTVRLSIEEPMAVKAFEEYLIEKWEHIAPINKDKNEVISWLQGQIKLLENKITSEVG